MKLLIYVCVTWIVFVHIRIHIHTYTLMCVYMKLCILQLCVNVSPVSEGLRCTAFWCYVKIDGV